MPERSNHEEQELFWQGHSFQDGCPLAKIPDDPFGCLLIPYYIPKAIVETVREVRQETQVFRGLRTFIALIPDQPMKRFGQGEVFNPTEVPIGTIVRYSEDSEAHEFKFCEERWGMVVQNSSTRTDEVISYMDRHLRHNIKILAMRVKVEKKIGEVEHFKRSERYQHLRRYNWVEIWQYGHGVRERVKNKIVAPGLITEKR